MKTHGAPRALALLPLGPLTTEALASDGFVETIPKGRSATLNADDGDLFVVKGSAGVSEEELRVISALKATLMRRFGAARRATPYVIDTSARQAQFLNPETRKYEALAFGDFLR